MRGGHMPLNSESLKHRFWKFWKKSVKVTTSMVNNGNVLNRIWTIFWNFFLKKFRLHIPGVFAPLPCTVYLVPFQRSYIRFLSILIIWLSSELILISFLKKENPTMNLRFWIRHEFEDDRDSKDYLFWFCSKPCSATSWLLALIFGKLVPDRSIALTMLVSVLIF